MDYVVLIECLLLLPLYMCGSGGRGWSLFYVVVVGDLSCFAIVLLMNRELIALLRLYY